MFFTWPEDPHFRKMFWFLAILLRIQYIDGVHGYAKGSRERIRKPDAKDSIEFRCSRLYVLRSKLVPKRKLDKAIFQDSDGLAGIFGVCLTNTKKANRRTEKNKANIARHREDFSLSGEEMQRLARWALEEHRCGVKGRGSKSSAILRWFHRFTGFLFERFDKGLVQSTISEVVRLLVFQRVLVEDPLWWCGPVVDTIRVSFNAFCLCGSLQHSRKWLPSQREYLLNCFAKSASLCLQAAGQGQDFLCGGFCGWAWHGFEGCARGSCSGTGAHLAKSFRLLSGWRRRHLLMVFRVHVFACLLAS